MKHPVLICGGGIGGLAMANCLQRVGIKYKIIEATPVFGVAGYGIGLGYNAMHCLSKINPDLEKRIQEVGVPSTSSFRTPDGQTLLTLDNCSKKYAKYSPSQFLPMSRQNLQTELLRDIESQNMILGKRVTSFKETDGVVTAFLSDGSSVQGSMLIGADGIKSSVRKCLHENYPDKLGPEPPVKFTNYTLLGGDVEMPLKEGEIQDFTWIFGEGKLAVSLPTKPDKNKRIIFWSIGTPAEHPMGQGEIIDEAQRKMLKELARPFLKNYEFGEYIENAKQFVVWDIYELDRPTKTEAWGHGRVTLLGDAAHAITPWVGQGAGISIEDAFDLTHRLIENPDNIPKAVQEYEKARIPRADFVRTMANFNFKFFDLFQYPFLVPVLKYYYKFITIPWVFDVFSAPLVAYNHPKKSLPHDH